MKLVSHQLVAADPAKYKSRLEGRDGEVVEPVNAITRTPSGTSYEQGQNFPRPYAPNNVQAINFYSYTASLDTSLGGESGELIGIDTYA